MSSSLIEPEFTIVSTFEGGVRNMHAPFRDFEYCTTHS